ncbi:MAG: hypothetical protein K8H87_06130 [Pseudorhodoplanes sp.]|nr:hypothetical protein [Pseudorhodoplanes sp.]
MARIFAPENNILQFSEWLADDAVHIERVSAMNFPDIRENTGNFHDEQASWSLAAATTRTSMGCSTIMRLTATATGGVRQNAREIGQIRPPTVIRTPGMATEVGTAHPVLRKGRKTVNIHANSTFIRGIPV